MAWFSTAGWRHSWHAVYDSPGRFHLGEPTALDALAVGAVRWTEDDVTDVIEGTKHNDNLVGTSGDDTIDGRKGADTMAGGAGSDRYYVDDAGDVVVELAGEGIDTIESRVTQTLAANVENLVLAGAAGLSGYGNALDNRLDGNRGANLLDGADGNDVLIGHRGNDTLRGGAGADRVDGGADNDSLDGGIGADTMVGSTGDDSYVVDDLLDVVQEVIDGGHDTVKSSVSLALSAYVEDLTLTGKSNLQGIGNELDNRLDGNQAANLLDGAGGSDSLIGHRGNDTLLGGAGNDWIDGGSDNDSLDGGLGADTMTGGPGNDFYVVDDIGDLTLEQMGGGSDTVYSTVDWNLADNIENLTLFVNGVGVGLKGTGNALNNLITGSFASDLIDGGLGNDTLDGGLYGGFPGSKDSIYGGEGDDVLTAGKGSFSVDTLDGGMGNDVLSTAAGSNWLYGGDGDDRLTGGRGDDSHHARGDRLYGGTGRDTLIGGTWMDGGAGDDLIQCSDLSGTISGGDGNDTIQGTGGGGYIHFDVDGGLGADQVSVFSVNNNVNVHGGEGDDTLIGDSLFSVLMDGGSGSDSVASYKLSAGTVSLRGDDGDDHLYAAKIRGGSVTLNGGDGNDSLTAIGGVDVTTSLLGGAGSDTLSAGAGRDTLTGGSDADLFVLSALEITNQDRTFITDFERNVDHLSVSQSKVSVGNGDQVVDGAVTVWGPGGFNASSELVIVAADIFGSVTLESAANAIGSANQAYAVGQSAVFMVDNGQESWAMYFQSLDGDAIVSAAELSVLAQLGSTPSIGVGDIVWGT